MSEPTAAENAARHIRTAGGIHTGLGVLAVVMALLMYALMSTAITAIEESTEGEEEQIAVEAVRFALGFAAIAALATGAVSIVGGVGMLQGSPWGRTAGYIASGVALLNIPLGTAVGIYGIVALGMEDAHMHFEEAHATA